MAEPKDISQDQLREILSILKYMQARLNGAPFLSSELPEDARRAALARAAATARGFFWVAEFAAVIGRHNQFVSDRCSARAIRTLHGGKPYRIPLSEEGAWNTVPCDRNRLD